MWIPRLIFTIRFKRIWATLYKGPTKLSRISNFLKLISKQQMMSYIMYHNLLIYIQTFFTLLTKFLKLLVVLLSLTLKYFDFSFW